mmetsp:Transcript_61790/g.145681  ORF Transcript_61790/g.145681 Transcript_61790/m.145681 type:complete len:306 (+) Transcript_61790:97-1014(+)
MRQCSSALKLCLWCLLAETVVGIPQVRVTEDLLIKSDGKDRKVQVTEDIRFMTLPEDGVTVEPVTDGTVAVGNIVVKTGISVDATQEVLVSPQCATVVMVTSGVLGAAVAWILTPVVLWMAGFAEIGVAEGSYAAAWQSTMPLVAKRSLFAALQSAAMSGVGATTLFSAAALGGAAGAGLIGAICKGVDNLKPGSPGHQVVQFVHSAVLDAEPIISNATKSAKSEVNQVAAALYASGWEQKLFWDIESDCKALTTSEWEHKVTDALDSWLDRIRHMFAPSGAQRSSLPTSWFLVTATACLLRAIV